MVKFQHVLVQPSRHFVSVGSLSSCRRAHSVAADSQRSWQTDRVSSLERPSI